MENEYLVEIAKLKRKVYRLQENQSVGIRQAFNRHRKKMATKENVYMKKRIAELEKENANLIETIKRLEHLI